MTIGPNDYDWPLDGWLDAGVTEDGRAQEIELNPPYDLGGYLPGAAKRVVINDYLPAGVLYVTPDEVIISKVGWESLVRALQIRNECNVAVRRIVERELRTELAWLRKAGHDV